ncbi:hypothetical protein [Streptomyces mirabilis]
MAVSAPLRGLAAARDILGRDGFNLLPGVENAHEGGVHDANER